MVLIQALDKFQVSKREHSENIKAQHLDSIGENGAKMVFRASELGNGDRKIIYSFFKHQLPVTPLRPKSLRIFENGDYVHQRYQSMFDDMGILLSSEERITSKEDEFLERCPWELAGHYDALVDEDIVQAHAKGCCTVTSVHVGEGEDAHWEIMVDIDEEYAKQHNIFDDNREPVERVIDIKSMNPWGFKRLAEKGDTSEIRGYIDQLQVYMYLLNTPYGSIFVEDKGSQDVVEVQLVWFDMHEGREYNFDDEQPDKTIRIKISNGRFFGSETDEGIIPRIDRLWQTRETLLQADAANDLDALADAMPPRCCSDPSKFPCSWGKGKEKCDFFDHCWDSQHQGSAIRPVEECPVEDIWEFFEEDNTSILIDSRKVPDGITYDGFVSLVDDGVLDYTKYLVDAQRDEIPAKEAMDIASEELPDADNLFDSTGTLKLTVDQVPVEAEPYRMDDKSAIDCLSCGKQIIYQRLGAGYTKKCPFCGQTNQVKH